MAHGTAPAYGRDPDLQAKYLAALGFTPQQIAALTYQRSWWRARRASECRDDPKGGWPTSPETAG